MEEEEKVLNLFKSSDISNHYLALSFIRSLNLDLDYIVNRIFHDKDYWHLPQEIWTEYNLILFDFTFEFCFFYDKLGNYVECSIIKDYSNTSYFYTNIPVKEYTEQDYIRDLKLIFQYA